ncbi:MAG: pyridoxamine 5'-phosphate oxidase family protein [Acidimicrobiales bacterium]
MENLAEIQRATFERATDATQWSYPPERRLSAEALDRYLDRRSFAVVATTRLDDRPHAAMSSYMRRGPTFWLPMVAGSVRERNVRRHPWVSLVVTEGDRGEHVVVLVEGPAQVIDPGEVPVDISTGASEEWVSLWMRLDAERVLSYSAEGVAL